MELAIVSPLDGFLLLLGRDLQLIAVGVDGA